MKPDGVNMETTEPTEAATVAEHSPLQEQAPSQPDEASNDAAPGPAQKANDKPVAADTKAKPRAAAAKIQPTAKAAGASRQVTSQRTVKNVTSSNSVTAAAAKKTATTTATTAKASAAGTASKRPVGAAAASPAGRNQTRVADRKPVGVARTMTTTAAAASVANGTKPTSANGIPKRRPVAETVRPKTTATSSRPVASTAPKPSTSTITKPAAAAAAISKSTRPATAPPASRPAATTSRTTTSTTSKPPSTTTAVKTAASRATTAPSTGRTTAVQTSKTAAAKKDVPRPLPAAASKKPSTATTSSVTKKNESSKPTAALKQNSASKLSTTSKVADPKVAQTKTQPPAKSAPTKKPLPVHLPATNKAPIGRTPPASPATKPVNSSTHLSKRTTKPTQAVPPFTAAKKTGVSDTTTPVVETQGAAGVAVAAVALAAAAATTVTAEPQTEAAASLPQGSSLPSSEPEEVPLPVLAQEITPEEPPETLQSHVASPQIVDGTQTTLPQVQPESSAPLLEAQEQITTPAEPEVPLVASSDLPKEAANQFTDQIPSISKAPPAAASPISQIISHTNLNEEEDEEEREGSQLVSVSEMSGTTQPTEESRPGSAGLVGGSAWRASGALLSELDSEEVSGSQQGASELSAPGVLEGTESMDDLGDGSLKGAIDMEGASAGSPDFEKVPDIPVNDFDEDEEDDDDDDRVCDMDVGSERADEPQRPRHDNDVDDDEDDEDVEMASEGVTESGLESYGNADEDDFAEDERLDNLNRVAQPPPPPPLLPAAPAAQWDQQNPFADRWAEPLFPQQVLENLPHPLQGAASAASPQADPWQAESETPTQTPAQAWLELGSSSLVPENQEVPNQSSAQDEPQNLEAVMYLDQSHSTMQTLAPAPPSAPGMSLSSTLSSETSTPEELGDLVKLQPQDAQPAELFPQADQDLGIHLEKEDQEGDEEAEAETLPADEVLGGPATAPTSNPSSSSVTEDEASDTEGEAQLEDSLEIQTVSNVTFDSQATARRCLSTVEENEEAEMSAITPPSATSLASYGFDTTTTASNSNAQSTGESCIKSPGIFSLEELPEEAKESFVIPPPHTEPSPTQEQQYIECGKLESAEQIREEVEAPDPSASLITLQQPEENQDDIQPPYYSAICEKTENSYAGFTALPHPHRRDHAAYPRTYCDIIKPLTAAVAAPKLTCADLPPRSPGQQALSPQLRRLEQHQRQLLEMQQRREQQSKPLEEAEQERKRREEEEQRKKKDEAEEEIKRNKEKMERMRKEQEEEEEKLRKEEELKQRKDLELQLQQQQEELKQRQQIMQWQQELQQSNKGQTVLLSPSSGLCTIYEALENSDEEEGEEDEINELNTPKKKKQNKEEKLKKVKNADWERVTSDVTSSAPSEVTPLHPPHSESPQTPNIQEVESPSFSPPESPERPPPLELDWGKKVDIVQQLINQTLMLNRDGCSSLLLLPGGAGGTLSPLESSLWPSLLPPLTPLSATVTSVSSFSPEATGSSPQGEWTVVELETHH